MEHLSKQQIVLLTLLVSFVTALSTGVVTVSLMNQAPASVGQTISRVIEKTIEAATSNQSAAAVSANAADTLANIVDQVSSSTVVIKRRDNMIGVGIGVIVSKELVIVTDKSVVAEPREYVAVLKNGKQIPITVIQSQINGDIVFLAPLSTGMISANDAVSPVLSALPKLGQTVLSLSGTSTLVLGQGLVTEVNSPIIHSSISRAKVTPGSPLFSVDGKIVGIAFSSLISSEGTGFYGIETLKGVIPVLKK